MDLEALKARNRECRLKIVVIVSPRSFRAFSAKRLRLVLPGPMAQAITFRAVGAENQDLRAGPTSAGSAIF
jgi:hypothetical protein